MRPRVRKQGLTNAPQPRNARHMLQAISVTKHMGSRTLFENLSWQVQRGDRIGLVGPNGAGKTTLMRMILGEESLDGGNIQWGRDETLGYLPQEAPRHDQGTALQRVLHAATAVQTLQTALQAAEDALSHAKPSEAEALALHHAELLDRYRMLDGYTLEARAREILSGLGFSQERQEAPLRSLSGGWWMRVELARLLLVRPDYLLLDEPTNHLDLESLQWLETFLAGYPGAWVVVSHDRYFLNRMVTSIAELSTDGLFMFPGNYDEYTEARAELAERLAAEARTHAKRVAEITSFIERFRSKASKARQVQSRIKLLDKQQGPEAPQQARRALRIKLPEPRRAGDIVLTMQGVHKQYGEHVVYRNLEVQIRRGEKIALVGPNGAGKTTLLKMLAGTLGFERGSRTLGHNVDVYYFAQHQLETLNPKNTVFEEMQTAMPLETISRIRSILGAFLFSDDSVDKTISVLSGGEKSRLALAKMLAQPANFLLLDEPTNHLDLQSRDVLEAALRDFPGTVAFISHDRYFINSIATAVLEVKPGGNATYYAGDYDYYHWKLAEAAQAAASQAAASGALSQNATSQGAQSYQARKDAQRQEKKQQREVARLEEEIERTEARLKEIDALMCDEAVYNDAPRCKALMHERAELNEGLEALYPQWEALGG